MVFPPVDLATEDGLVAVGGDLRVETLLEAYRNGIFPWPLSPDFPLAWFSPDPRGVLVFADLHVPRSLAKGLRQSAFELRHDESFTEIVRLCAAVPRKGQQSTWITPEIVAGYSALFAAGHAWCTGAWIEGRLVGGVYGVKLAGFRSGESMFTVETNAGKASLLAAVERFRGEGVAWLDTQMVTPVVASLGGKELPREEFLGRLRDATRSDTT